MAAHTTVISAARETQDAVRTLAATAHEAATDKSCANLELGKRLRSGRRSTRVLPTLLALADARRYF